MFVSNQVPLTVRGKQYEIEWTLDAAIAAELVFGLARASFKKACADYAEREGNLGLLKALAFCMLQSSDQPPTMKELGRMHASEIEGFREAVAKALGIGEDGPLGESGAADGKLDAASAAGPGTGASSLDLRPTVVV